MKSYYIIKEIVYSVYNTYKKRVKYNVFNKNHKKKALLSYIVEPFSSKKLKIISHTNTTEALNLAKALDQSGYIVDVCEFNKKYKYLNLKEYDLIIGLGHSLENALKQDVKAKTILYATGSTFESNLSVIKKRILNSKPNIKTNGYRIPEYNLFLQNNFTDAVICLGNYQREKEFQTYPNRKIISVQLPLLFEKNSHERDIQSINKSRNSFIWFGSTGIKHKGLDILIDIFHEKKDISLIICGDVMNELIDLKLDIKLKKSDNIKYLGFLKPNSDEFQKIAKSCLFSILPSCSEGVPGAIVNTTYYGNMIPIFSKYVAIDCPPEYLINDLNKKEISIIIDRLTSLNDKALLELQMYWKKQISLCCEKDNPITKITNFLNDNYRASVK